MLRAVAFHHPVDHVKLRRLMAEWHGVVDFDTFRTTRSNLVDLGLIVHPRMDENDYLTKTGWEQLGGETPLDDGTTWSSALY